MVAIEELALNRVVVAGCSHRLYAAHFQELMHAACHDHRLLARVNLREQVVYHHANNGSDLTAKAQSLLAMAAVYEAQKKPELAIEQYEEYSKIDKGNALVHFYLGALYERAGNKKKAEDFFREAIRLNPDISEPYNYLGYMFAEEGRNLDEALKLVEKALEIAPDNGAYIDSLGWAYFKLKEYEQAEFYLKKAVQKLPDDPVINDHLGDLYFQIK